MRIRFFEITRGKNKISMKFVYKNVSYTEEEEKDSDKISA